MELSGIAFTALAVLHSLAGLVLLAFTSDEAFQSACVYEGRNPLVGDILKYLVSGAGLSLAACGFAVFYLPIAVVVLAWISLTCYALTWFVDAAATRSWPKLCIACTINFAVRAAAASALTLAYHYAVRA